MGLAGKKKHLSPAHKRKISQGVKRANRQRKRKGKR